jgi:hypothetical protein
MTLELCNGGSMHVVSKDNNNATERRPFGLERIASSFAAPIHAVQLAIQQSPTAAPVRRFGRSLPSRSEARSGVWHPITPETQTGSVSLQPKFARDDAAA